jgi:ribosomal-protein-serine acetyltransferase
MFSLKLSDDLELQLLEDRHSEDLFDLVDQNRPLLRQWLPWVDTNVTVGDTRNFIKNALDHFANDAGLVAGIWYQNRIIGVIGFNSIDWQNRIAHIGYWLDAAHQGNGFVTRACRALIDYAFDELELNRIEIHCAVGNSKSRAVPERLGFSQEGLVRHAEWLYDRFVDHAIYGILASDWNQYRER